MINMFEVNETNNMITQDKLDVRTITMGISLLDCIDSSVEKVCENVEFVVIDWDNKVMELDSKKIDVVWNGMTLTDEVTKSMECTNAYCNNAQVVVEREK